MKALATTIDPAWSPPVVHRLHRLISPSSVAVVGASESGSSFGGRTLANLKGFQGRIYPVNPKAAELQGIRCYPDLKSLPEAPDCVVIAVGREHVQGVVDDCVAAGAGGVVIYASGYQETGIAHLTAMQDRLVATARASGMPIVGPNCLGLLNYEIGMRALFPACPEPRSPGDCAVGLVSQSGAIGVGLLQAVERGVSISHLLTAGNSCDVDAADFVEYLVTASECRAIACVLEGVADPRKFLKAGAAARRAGKPVVVCKCATGAEGAAASVSHTGSLAGSQECWLALFRQAGFVVVERLEDLVETAAFLAKAPRPAGSGIAVISGSGGAAIIAADRAEVHGVSLPQPQGDTLTSLQAALPSFGTARNPCDVTALAQHNADVLYRCVDAFLVDTRVAALVIPNLIAGAAIDRYDYVAAAAGKVGKIVCIPWSSEWLDGPGSRKLAELAHVALFHSTDRCLAAIAAWQNWWAAQGRSISPQAVPTLHPAAGVLWEGRNSLLTEVEGKKALGQYGIPVVRESIARSADEAVRAAEEMGYPVVMKVQSPDIPHKTEAGGVALDLRDAPMVRAAFTRILGAARAYNSGAQIDGVVIQSMVPQGVEILVGGRSDPLFGPVLTVGFGGIFVELLKDVQTALCPVSHGQALELLGELKGQALLDGFRGMPAVDRDALAAVICKMSDFLVANPGRVAEFEVNPLICVGRKIVAVDALIRRSEPVEQRLLEPTS